MSTTSTVPTLHNLDPGTAQANAAAKRCTLISPPPASPRIARAISSVPRAGAWLWLSLKTYGPVRCLAYDPPPRYRGWHQRVDRQSQFARCRKLTARRCWGNPTRSDRAPADPESCRKSLTSAARILQRAAFEIAMPLARAPISYPVGHTAIDFWVTATPELTPSYDLRR
jgi:hypothetical protein